MGNIEHYDKYIYYYLFRTAETIDYKKFVYGSVKTHYILNQMMKVLKFLFRLQILLKIAHTMNIYIV